MERTESVIGEYQEKTKLATEELKTMKEVLKSLEAQQEESDKQLQQALATNENNQLLINEYREKNDTLTGLVNEYKSYAEENKQLKEQFQQEREQLHAEQSEMQSKYKTLQDENNGLNQQIEVQKATHVNEMERVKEKFDYEKNKALLEVEKEYQHKLLQANESYTAKIQALYDEMDKMRKEHEQKMEQLKQERDRNE